MSSTNSAYSSLLVISNHVYAKREDGNFYPGSVESKTDATYMIAFDDDTREQVLEEDLTWLGFWGLPPCNWPKTPVIQSNSSAGMEFDAKISFLKSDTDVRGHIPASLTMLKKSCSSSSFLAVRDRPSMRAQCCCGRQRFLEPPRTLTRQQDIQNKNPQRPSVLMLNKKVLSKELRQNNADIFAHFIPTKEPTKIDLCSASSFESTSKSIRKDGSNFTNINRTSETRKNEMFERIKFINNWKSVELPEGKYQYSCVEEKDVLEQEGINYQARTAQISPRSDTSHQSWDWYETSYFNQSALTPPVTPSSPSTSTSPDLPSFGHEAHDIRLAREEWEHDTKEPKIGPWKKRRRDDLKKCRKVYGVVNRHLWCTQCKWKKACARFKA